MTIKEKLIEILNEKYPHIKLKDDIEEIKDRNDKVTVTCNKHGEIVTSLAYIRKNKKHICTECYKELLDEEKLSTDYSDKIKALEERYPNLNFSEFKYINSKTKSVVSCPEHGKFETSYGVLMDKRAKYGCPECSGNKVGDPLTELRLKFPNLDFSEFNYVNNETKGIVICPEHGEFESSRGTLLHDETKHGCPKCRSIELSIRFTKDSFTAINNMRELYPNFDYSKFEYKDSRTPSIVICPKHGEFTTNYDNFMRRRCQTGCPYCSENHVKFMKLSEDKVLKDILDKYPDIIIEDFEYVNSRHKFMATCKEHGQFETSYRYIMLSKVSPCPYCSKKKVFEPVEFLKNKFPELDFSKYVYTDTKTKSTVICKKHGEFESSFAALKKSVYGCGKCGASFSSSSYEKEIVEFIETIYDKEIVRNTRKLIKNEYSGNYLELDIYLPDINLAIEFNGKYFHTDENIANNTHGFKSAKEYHDYKLNKCNEIGIDLIHIFEMDYVLNKEDFFYRLKDKISNMSNI